MFEVYQVQLTDKLYDIVNSQGWDANKATKVYADLTFGPNAETVQQDYVIAAAAGILTRTMKVFTDDLDVVFAAGNNMPTDARVVEVEKHKSVSVGDLIVDSKTDVGHIVDRFGFIPVAPNVVADILNVVEVRRAC